MCLVSWSRGKQGHKIFSTRRMTWHGRCVANSWQKKRGFIQWESLMANEDIWWNSKFKKLLCGGLCGVNTDVSVFLIVYSVTIAYWLFCSLSKIRLGTQDQTGLSTCALGIFHHNNPNRTKLPTHRAFEYRASELLLLCIVRSAIKGRLTVLYEQPFRQNQNNSTLQVWRWYGVPIRQRKLKVIISLIIILCPWLAAVYLH